ncbi:NfuA family Fe-S biogenesis protein [Buchnera aphidicola]|uniref:NfuA family Fe-S biogenesis protein n=1 Tax=Buchnera aphidicola TaxID=9 RepID=UPI003BEEF4E6
MITISPSAQNYFVSLLLKEPKGTQIRVFILNPGTPYAECGVAYCLENEIEKSDVKFKYDNFYIYVNKLIVPYLKNAEIDLIIDKLGSQLTLKAPYSKTNFFKKQSSLESDIEEFLNTDINPHLLSHKGRVHLLKIVKEKIAIIKFSGGCNGCSMIAVTLKNTIEKKLLSRFPQLKEIRDETDHLHGVHSFY